MDYAIETGLLCDSRSFNVSRRLGCAKHSQNATEAYNAQFHELLDIRITTSS